MQISYLAHKHAQPSIHTAHSIDALFKSTNNCSYTAVYDAKNDGKTTEYDLREKKNITTTNTAPDNARTEVMNRISSEEQ
jgi:hypothetical protein